MVNKTIQKTTPNFLFYSFESFLPIFFYQVLKNSECSIVVLKEYLTLAFKVLKSHIGTQYSLLSCISGVDLVRKKYRFMVSYELLSLTYNSRIRVKTFVNEYSILSSITPIFESANWWEREVWDMYGIYFENHPDLRRILTDYGFEGYPLRKDFPLIGFYEFRYNNNTKTIVADLVRFSQDYRYFNYEMPW